MLWRKCCYKLPAESADTVGLLQGWLKSEKKKPLCFLFCAVKGKPLWCWYVSCSWGGVDWENTNVENVLLSANSMIFQYTANWETETNCLLSLKSILNTPHWLADCSHELRCSLCTVYPQASHASAVSLFQVSSAGNSNKAFGYSLPASEVKVLIECLHKVPICSVWIRKTN